MKNILEAVGEIIDKVKEKLVVDEDKGKDNEEVIDKDDVIPKLDPPILEEPFLKFIKGLGIKALKGASLFNDKMDTQLVME